jgi:radical SAM protein with 4Fe4S-binding SPASM domain
MSSALGLSTCVRRFFSQAREVLYDVPEAFRREYDYGTGMRRSAILSLTWRCTSHCQSCTAWRRPAQRARELSVQEWLEVAAKLAASGVRSFELFGGDVLLRKEVLFPLCKAIHASGGEVHIATNCNLLDDEVARLFAETAYALYLSTDGLESSHDTIRGTPGTFDRLAQARQRLLTMRGACPTPKLICNTTICQDNAAQAYDVAAYALKSGCDEIDFEYIGQFEDEHVQKSCIAGSLPSPIFMRSGPSRLLRAEQAPMLREQLTRARELTGQPTLAGRPFRVVTLNIDVLADHHLVDGTVPGKRCFVERAMVVVDPYGSVVPCLFFDNICVGDVRQGALDRSLETTERRQFRDFRDNGRLELCRHCIMSVIRNRTGWDVLRRAYIQGGQPRAEESFHGSGRSAK